jgi:hypothetical protein
MSHSQNINSYNKYSKLGSRPTSHHIIIFTQWSLLQKSKKISLINETMGWFTGLLSKWAVIYSHSFEGVLHLTH